MDIRPTRRIVLFDGVCNLCSASVIFVLRHKRAPLFQFASIQSEIGRQLMQGCGLSSDYNQAVILIDQGKIYSGSSAALRIGQTLKFPWSILSALGFLLPKSFRDWVYSQIAKHRYQWFGKRDVCMVLTEDLKTRCL